MKYYLFGIAIVSFVGCSSTPIKPRGCPELDSRASCAATAAAERNMIE